MLPPTSKSIKFMCKKATALVVTTLLSLKSY